MLILAACALCETEVEQAQEQLWFQVGETLEYKVKWGIVSVGSIKLTSEWVEVDGLSFVKLRAEADSNYIVRTLYPVRDRIEAIVDPLTFLPVVYTQDVKEGSKQRYDRVTFSHKHRKAARHNRKGWKRCPFS